MPPEVECVLPCDSQPQYRVVCHGSTFRELFDAAHDNECLCQLLPRDHAAWVLEGNAITKSETPPAGSRRVDMDEVLLNLRAEGCATVAWEDSDGYLGPSSDTILSTSPNLLSSPVKISQGVFKSDSNKSNLPSCSLTAYPDVLASPGVVWVDKSSYLAGLSKRADRDPRLALVHRPAGFGKTSFLAMAEFFHDVKYHNSPESLWIGDLAAANRHKIDLHEDLVLSFDLAATREADFEASLIEHVNTVLKQFLSKYQQELQILPEYMSCYIHETGLHSLAGVLDLVTRSDQWRAYVCIDNYNAPTLARGGETAEIKKSLDRFLVGPLSGYLTDCHSGLIMGVGDQPDPRMSRYHSHPSVWVDIASDLTDDEMVESAFGFTLEEVHELAREFKVQGVESVLEARSFVSDLESYSMREVLDEIGRQCRERETEVAKAVLL